MKKIKYRTWDKEENRWADHNQQLSEVSVSASVNSPSVLTIGEDRYELMLFTGLKDRNGKDIYEGDIIEEWDDGRFLWKVKWDSQYSCFYIFEHHIWENFYHDDMIEVFAEGKVIGNIYENPELLQ